MTEEEMREQINAKVTQYYPKMVRDSQQIAGTNFEKYGQDLLAYVLEDFLVNKDLEYQYKVAVIDDKLVNWVGYSMALQIKSSTSPFWFRYRKSMYNNRGIYLAEDGTEEIDPTIDIYLDEIDEYFDTPFYFKNELDCVRYALTQIHWYHGRLIQDHFIDGLTYGAMHKKYKISLNSLKKDIDKALIELRKICSHFH
jgi:hypothetical protein